MSIKTQTPIFASVSTTANLKATFTGTIDDDHGSVMLECTVKGNYPGKSVWMALYESDPSVKGFDLTDYYRGCWFYVENASLNTGKDWGNNYYFGIVMQDQSGNLNLLGSGGPTQLS